MRPASHRARRSHLAVTVALSLALALALALAACGSDESASDQPTSSPTSAAVTTTTDRVTTELPAAVQKIDIEGTEYAFDFAAASDSPLRPGWTKVTFHNGGVEAHQVMFASLKEGVDLAELAEAAGGDSSGSAAIAYVDMLGGVSYVGPDQTVEAMVDLPEGVVLAMCYVPDPEGVAHALSGMSTALTVSAEADPDAVATDGTSPAGAEAVQGTIVMDAEGYQLPSPLPAGWYEVVNRDGGSAGEGLHELSILGLEEELDAEGLDELLGDLAVNEAPAVPLDALGGMGALSGGFTGYLYLDLEPGPYLAVDFMPDPGEPRPHLLDGYVTAFEP